MATRRTSSRKAKDAASDFVRRVMSGKWEDHRDVSPPSYKSKKTGSQSPSRAASAPVSPARSNHGNRAASPASSSPRAKVASPKKPQSTKSTKSGSLLKKALSLPTKPAAEQVPAMPELSKEAPLDDSKEAPQLVLNEDSEQRNKDTESPPKLELIKEVSKSEDDGKDSKMEKLDDGNSPQLSGDEEVPTIEDESVNTTIAAPEPEEGPPLEDASQDSKRGRGRPRKRICVEKPIIDDSRSTRPRGRPRKYTVEERPPTAVKKKGTKSFIPAYRTFVKDPTEIKEEIIDDGYEDQSVDTEKKKGQKSLVVSLERLEDTMTGASHSVGNAKDLDRQISRCSSRDSLVSMTTDESEQQVKKKGKKKKKQLDKVNDGEEMPYVCEIKEEPLKEEPSVPNGDATTTENTSNDFEFSTIEDSAITYPAPSAQRQYFNLFGLIKKSDIKDDSLRNKLHREAGGKLRRILKPKMAPEMVYKRLTLAKGCVIQGLNPEIPRPGSSSQKITAKPKILQAEPIKPKPKETKKGGIKLSMMELELAERLLKVGDIQSVRHLLLEGKLPTPKDSPKKKEWLKPPPKKKIVIPKDEDKKPEDIVVKLSTSTIVKTRPKVPLTKKTSFGSVSSDKDDDAPGTRRSTRQRGGQRKQWWHLLRAAPDEFEEDKQWDEEQDRLDKKRRTLQEKKSHKMLLGQLVAAEEVGGEEEEEELPSSQGSSVSTASNATATAIAAKKKPKKRSLLLEPKQETSDVSLYSELYDEPDTSTCKKNSKKKDWLLAKRVLEEAKKHNGEVSIESILLDLRKKELQEAASGNKDDGPPVKKKKKKKKSVDASKDENAVRNHVNIVNQIKPLLKNFMDDTNRGTTATTLEMELEAAGNLDMVTSVKSVEVDGVTNTEFFPRVTITDNDLCKVPHMCYICWINDHMYTLNTKRTARDLPPFGGCLHYNPCEHYLKRCTDKITVKPDQQPTPDDPVSAESILRPVTEKDLFCSEKMPESDDSAPVSPGAPEGTELLSVQLKARAAQIAQSLDGATESEKPPEVVIDKDESPKDPPEEVSVTQHGAEIVIHAGRAHPPNYEELAEADRSRQMWLQSLTQSLSTSDSEKTNKVKIKLEGEEEEKLNDAEEVCKKFAGSSKHKLVRVKVQRVGNNKILLKQTREGRNKQRVEVLVREIELPVSAEGNTDYLDTEWLSGILAEEAIKLASAEEEIKQKQRTLKKLVVEKPQEKKPKTPPPEEEEVAWTMETIVSEGEEEVEEEEEKVSDIDEPEDSATTGNINVGGNGNAPDQPITIKKQAVKVPESLREGSIINEDGSEMLSVTTKDIREERPQLMNYIKDSGLARAIYQKLEVERQSLSKITEESDYVKSLVGDDLEQKLCLRAALNSERTMKQDELRTKRDDANYTGRATSDLARRCSMLEKKRIDLEDEIESCMSVLEIVQMEGMLDGHPEEVDRINRINSKMQEALRPEVQAVSVAPSPTPEALEVQPPLQQRLLNLQTP